MHYTVFLQMPLTLTSRLVMFIGKWEYECPGNDESLDRPERLSDRQYSKARKLSCNQAGGFSG